MFYIYSISPEHGDIMNRYEADEMDEIFGEYDANQLRNGISVFCNGAIHVNAAHAAMAVADDMLVNG